MVPSLMNDNRPTIAVIREHKRTNRIYLNVKSDSIFIDNSFFKQNGPNLEHPTEQFENGTTFLSNNESENEFFSREIQKRNKPPRI